VIRFRPDVLFILGLSFLLTARASLIPSSPRRTLLVGIGSSVPLVAATFVLYRLADAAGLSVATFYPGDRSTPLLYACWAAVFSGMSAGVSTFVSAVIYGLQREVQKARKLGQYTLERELGSGGMGVVYLARHALLRRPTAVKLLLPERAGASSLARFEREVQITSSLTHPNTVAIYDYGRTLDGTFYYAMEHLDGLDLQTLVERGGPLPPARVRHFLRQIAGALSEAHQRGLIHRDIKPSNIMVCERGFTPDFVKVLDFGLARPVVHGDAEHAGVSVTQAGRITGTPLYLSPEQIQTPDDLDGRSDLYALGAVGYFLLTGHALFSGSVVQVCAHHLHTAPPRASQRSPEPVPRMLENVLLTCLEKDRARRPRDAGELAQLLDACSDVAPWTEDEARAAAQAMPRGAAAATVRTPEHNSLAVAVTARDVDLPHDERRRDALRDPRRGTS
jgi:serine/threonine-protein kinase